MEMKQTGLTQRILEAVGLDISMVKGKFTPAEAAPLVKDADGECSSGTFNYAIVVGISCIYQGTQYPT